MAKAKKEPKQQAREGRIYMQNPQGFKVQVLNKPEQLEKLKSYGWTEV